MSSPAASDPPAGSRRLALELAGRPDAPAWAGAGLPQVEVPGLYVHVPFCFHKCHYCDFYSITRQSRQRMERFVDLVLREATRWAGGREGPRLGIRTVFFGGGTPSLLPLDCMERLVLGLQSVLDMGAVEEWTVECNPATLTPDYCRRLRDLGVDRLSFGAQSFDPAELKLLERHHDPADVPASIGMARAAGFRRLNLDLIYAIPGQEMASWEASLERAIELQTEHISCYGLTYEPNTPIAVKRRLGLLRAAEDNLELQMLHTARWRLAKAGYAPYEISNYAQPGEACRHNLLYWHGGSYIGLGPSAASHVEGWRWRNRPHLGEWEEAVGSGTIPAADVEQLSAAQRAGELAMLQLRLEAGVDFEAFADQTGVDARAQYRTTLDRLSSLGLLVVDARGFRLSERGLNVADAIAAEFVAEGGGALS